MKKIVLLTLATTLFIFSCKKNKTELTHKIEGVTLDSRAIAYPEVAGVNLLLEEKKLEGGVFNGAFVEVATTTSDQFGNYEFSFEKRNTVEYQLTATKPNFFPYQQALDPSLIKPGLTYDKNVYLVPKAWVKTEIINEQPLDQSDEVTFKFANASFDCDCCTNALTTYTGTVVNETAVCQVFGNKWMKYITTVSRTGYPQIITIDSVYCSSFDTTTVEIHY